MSALKLEVTLDKGVNPNKQILARWKVSLILWIHLHIHLVKSPWKVFGKGREGDRTNLRSVLFKQPKSDLLLLV